jgi:Flp pilus assembly protein TadG
MELVLTLPILAVLLLGLFEFSLLFFARGDVVDACRAGAKQASLQGATQADVEAAVLNSLSPRLQENCVVEANLGQYSGDPVSVAVSVPMTAASPDLLWVVGFSLQEQNLYCQTHMNKE